MAATGLPAASWRRIYEVLIFLACCSCADAIRGSRDAGARRQDPAPETTAIGKVVTMLEAMKVQSEENKAEADSVHAQVQGNCTATITETNTTLQGFTATIDSSVALISQLDVDITGLEETVAQHETDMQRNDQELQIAQRAHANATAVAAQDIADYDAAIAALDRAAQILAATGFLQKPSAAGSGAPRERIKMALSGVKKSLHKVKRYTPDTEGGIAKDEHLFDDFENLTTASTSYTVQSGNIQAILQNLKGAIQMFKQQYMTDNTRARQLDEQEAANLEAQIDSARTAQSAAQGSLATKRQELMTAREDLAESRANQNATGVYLARVVQACDDRIAAYNQMNELRQNEIQALTRAIEIISSVPGANVQTQQQAASSLLRVRTETPVYRAPRRDTGSLLITQQKVLGYLREEASKLRTQSLDQLVEKVGELVTQDPGSNIEVVASSDPMAKVRGMIQELITRLQAEAAQESSHKAWCDGEIAENDRATESATADIEKHTARGDQLHGDIARLAMELDELNTTLAQAVIDRASLVEQRNVSQTENQQVIEEAQTSQQAVEAAIMLLEQYYQNASQQLALVQVEEVHIVHVGAHSAVAKAVSQAAVGKKVAAHRQTPSNTTAPTELPPVVTQPQVAGPLAGESQGVLAMLNVVRDGYIELIRKTEAEEQAQAREHYELLQEHDVMVAAAEKDVSYKTLEKEADIQAMNVSAADLNASVQLLADASATREQLGPPCLNVETYEERKAKRDEEITALREAFTMIEQYEAEMGGMAFLQSQEGRRSGINRQLSVLFNVPLAVLESARVTANASANATANATAKAGANATSNATRKVATKVPLTDVVELLEGIRTEVQTDLADDTTVYNNMVSWCTTTIEQKQQAIADANDRDRTLVTLIETSAASRSQLETELEQLEQDLAEAQASLQQATSLRTNELEKFREEEKEMIASIDALRHALIVLDRHYNHTGTQPALDAAVAQAEADVGSTTAAQADQQQQQAAGAALLVSVAGQVKQALKFLPPGDPALASVEANVILQDFLNRPQDATAPHRASLTATGASVLGAVSAGQMQVDGHQVVGILSQLLETFEADLLAAQQRNTRDNTTFVELQDTKGLQVEALQESITNKQAQLATHMVANSEGHEDLDYLRAAREADTKLLYQVQQQCRDTHSEFGIRNETRHREIASLNQAITILSAEASAAATTTAAPQQQQQQFLLHSSNASSAPAHHIFVRHRKSHVVSTTPAPQKAAGSIVDAFIKSHKFAALPPRKRLPRHAKGGAAPKGKAGHLANGAKLAAAAMLRGGDDLKRLKLPGRAPVDGATAAAAARQKAKKALLELAGRQSPGQVNQVLDEGLQTVAGMIDTLRADLLEQRQLEIHMKDTCLSERHQATAQLERRQSDESRFNATIERKTNEMASLTSEIAALRTEIQGLNDTMNAAIAARSTEYDGFRTSVQEQEDHQAKLHEAIQSLQAFYEQKTELNSANVFLQLEAVPAHASKQAVAKAAHAAVVAAAAQHAVKLAAKVTNSSDNTPGQTSAPRPANFSKPMNHHGGGSGVIGILQLLVEESEAMVEAIVEAETSARDAHGLDLEGTRRSIEAKDNEIVVMTQTMGNLEAEKNQQETLRAACQTEMQEIEAFLLIVAQRCDYLLANFQTSQDARTQEIDNLLEAKQAILGAIGSATTLTQIASRIEH